MLGISGKERFFRKSLNEPNENDWHVNCHEMRYGVVWYLLSFTTVFIIFLLCDDANHDLLIDILDAHNRSSTAAPIILYDIESPYKYEQY